MPPDQQQPEFENRKCTKCFQVLPAEKFDPMHPDGLCCYCAAQQVAKMRDEYFTDKARDLAHKLAVTHGIQQMMSTVEEYLSSVDEVIGGVRQYALKTVECIDGMIGKKQFSMAGNLILNIQKLRHQIQKQHSEEDFNAMTLEQKKARLQLELMQFMREQSTDSDKFDFMVEAFAQHGLAPPRPIEPVLTP